MEKLIVGLSSHALPENKTFKHETTGILFEAGYH